MSTTTIHWTLRVGAVLTDATSAVLSDPTGAFGVRRLDTGAVVVADATPLVHLGVGTYEYTFTDPAAGLTYNYWVEFVYAGNTYRIEQDISGGTGGGGPGTVIAKALPDACVSLARYAEVMELNENAFWGLNDGSTGEPCDHIWTDRERKRVARYLSEAQEEIEQAVGYPLCPRWFEDEPHPYAYPVHTKWGKVIEGGFRQTAVIAAGTAPSYVTDPAVVGPLATTVTDEDEVHVYYPGSDREITPETVTIAGGFVTITIPWCRLVDPAYFNNPADGWDYSNPTYYTPTVDVTRVYNDDSIQAGIIWPHRSSSSCDCDCSSCCGTCGEYSVNACMYVRNPETGAIDVLEAAHDVVTGWAAVCNTCYCAAPEILKLNYRAGLEPLTLQAEDAVIRLAHSKMPFPPCGCDLIADAWKRDRTVPDNMTLEQANCAFGQSNGAYWAWRQTNMMMLKRGIALG